MLLPDKHLQLSESVLGFAGLVLSLTSKPSSFDALWKLVQERISTPEWPASHGVENFSLRFVFCFPLVHWTCRRTVSYSDAADRTIFEQVQF